MEYEVMEHKDWVESEGCYPTRVVLLKLNDNPSKYSTHLQIDPRPEMPNLYLAHGHYFVDLEDAVKDFKGREV